MRTAGIRARALCLLLPALSFDPAEAGEPLPDPALPPQVEVWTGLEAFHQAWSLYSGATWGLGSGVQQEGWRLRFVAGASSFATPATVGTGRGVAPFAELLAGYQAQTGPVTVKAFAGAVGVATWLTPEDLQRPLSQAQFGPKFGLEAWYAIDDRAWASLDVSWSAPYGAYWSRARLAHRLAAPFSLGLEAGASGTGTGAALRGGTFARYEWEGGEIALSGGLAVDGAPNIVPALLHAGGSTRPYTTLMLLMRF